MNAMEELLRSESRASYSRFFLGIGRKAREKWRDEMTGQLFGITEYLKCEGMLAKDAVPQRDRLPKGIASRETPSAESAADAAYLARCEAAIRRAAEEWRA